MNLSQSEDQKEDLDWALSLTYTILERGLMYVGGVGIDTGQLDRLQKNKNKISTGNAQVHKEKKSGKKKMKFLLVSIPLYVSM